MFLSERGLRGTRIKTKDGHIGKTDEFYFDEKSWAVRYMVVIYGVVPHSRKLISPPSLVGPQPDGFAVDLTTEQIRNSPDIDEDKPLSRQKEEELHTYYGWSNYWSYPAYTNAYGVPLYPGFGFAYPYSMPLQTDREMSGREMPETLTNEENTLRSTNEVIGYEAMSRDDKIGSVEDFLIDDQAWAFRYTIIDTGRVFPGKKVIVASYWTESIDWLSRTVNFDVETDYVRNGPTLEEGTSISREFEQRLFDYYRKPYYWKQEVGQTA